MLLDGGEQPDKAEQDLNSGKDDEDCSEWRTAKDIEYRTHLYFLKFDLKEEKVSDDDVTFVAQVRLRYCVSEKFQHEIDLPTSPPTCLVSICAFKKFINLCSVHGISVKVTVLRN